MMARALPLLLLLHVAAIPAAAPGPVLPPPPGAERGHAPASAPAAAVPFDRVVLPDDTVPIAYRISVAPDMANPTFSGSGEIDIDVRRATDRLVLNSAELEIDAAELSGEPKPATTTFDLKRETVALSFGHRIAPGKYTLRLAWRGHINDHASGLFRLRYGAGGQMQAALFTQFEDSDARRFLPCWDEPGRKATFELSATVPETLFPVGNMPVVATEALPGGLKRVRFAPTPRMSTYLLFFGLGDFERVHRDVAGVDVGVIVKRGDTSRAGYALDAAAEILPFYDDYFGTPYPLPKLDMIAGAGDAVSFGAMENWGAIFYFERYLLVDPVIDSQRSRQDVFSTVAHEVAHQWFGNLVTMGWWDDLWLNEGFASWMQAKAAVALHPEWHLWLQTLKGKQHAMDQDARRGTHPVVARITDVSQVESVFDNITYAKGQQVIRTLESWIGEDAFRDGVRRYMREHAYGNTTTDDFWRALDQGSMLRPIERIAHDLTRQPGVPMVTATEAVCVGGRTHVALATSQFSIDPPEGPAAYWQLPVTLGTLGNATARTVVGSTRQATTLDGCGPLILNAGQTAYFRSRYPAPVLASLTARFAQLEPADQLGLLNDTSSLALHGELPVSALLALMRAVPATAEPEVLATLSDQLRVLDRLQDGLVAQPAFRGFARALLQPAFMRVGWTAQKGEGDGIARLRADLIVALGSLDDPAVVAESRRRFDRFEKDASSLDGGIRQAVLSVVALQADDSTWDRLHAHAQHEANSLERQEFYELLGTARDPSLGRRAMALALSGEPPATVAVAILDETAGLRPVAALDFVESHWAALEPVLGGRDAAPTVVRGFFEQGFEPDLPARIQRFADAHGVKGDRRSLDRTISLVRYRAQLRDLRVPEIERWLVNAKGPG